MTRETEVPPEAFLHAFGDVPEVPEAFQKAWEGEATAPPTSQEVSPGTAGKLLEAGKIKNEILKALAGRWKEEGTKEGFYIPVRAKKFSKSSEISKTGGCGSIISAVSGD